MCLLAGLIGFVFSTRAEGQSAESSISAPQAGSNSSVAGLHQQARWGMSLRAPRTQGRAGQKLFRPSPSPASSSERMRERLLDMAGVLGNLFTGPVTLWSTPNLSNRPTQQMLQLRLEARSHPRVYLRLLPPWGR